MHDHDHDHDRTVKPMVEEITDFEVLEIALRELCIEKGIFTAEEHRRFTEFAEQIGPTPAARLVARAWLDPDFKALAVAARKRSPLLPDVPTSHEQGLPEFDIAPFYAVFAPSGTPQAVVEKLADALNKGLNEEAVQKRLADLGANSVEQRRRGPKALADLVKSETERLMPILRAAAEK